MIFAALYLRTRNLFLVVGVHALYGAPAAIVTAGVMVWAVIIVVAQVRQGRRKNATRSTLTSAPI